MSAQAIKTLTDPVFLTAILVGIAVFATMLTLIPSFGSNPLKNRMKAVALERDELRARQRARLAAEAEQRSGSLRQQQSTGMRRVVEKLDLRRLLADESTTRQLKTAGFRGQNPMTRFLFFRLVLPFAGLALAIIYIFGLGVMGEKPLMIRVFACIGAAYAGFYAPVLYVTNRASKRKESIQNAWPDALDLMLICVESGMSIEAAMRKVSDEIGSQSVELAEEFVLTTAELSYLQERRQAYENLAERTGLAAVKSVTQALVQAERYGTPVAHALRVLSSESRDARMTEAEKKAAALPPKLTVPMILFFLPVLFAIILGPAGIQLSQNGGFFGDQPRSSVTQE